MKKKIAIKGDKVQDVDYRLFLLDAAEDLGLKGFQARNVKDYVEFIVEGDDDRVIEFVEFARSNYPEFAKVDEVREEDYGGEVMSIDGFYHRFSVDQLVKIVNVGISMIGRQDSMIEKQDIMIEKQDLMLGKMDLMLGKQDEMLKKQDETIMEIRALREDLKSYMEQRFEKIEKEIAAIKAKIGL
ncbi:MAG: acylphosphatase [Thermoproteota archaeon]